MRGGERWLRASTHNDEPASLDDPPLVVIKLGADDPAAKATDPLVEIEAVKDAGEQLVTDDPGAVVVVELPPRLLRRSPDSKQLPPKPYGLRGSAVAWARGGPVLGPLGVTVELH
eukprot:9491074-Pyramimonas_sp.AAC.1